MTNGVVALFVGTVPFFFKELLYYLKSHEISDIKRAYYFLKALSTDLKTEEAK